ncbi:hypothetical protein I541_5560 [Mycobacteroides abscessus]|nr:hypothetical protein I541_5560 [Mycobacteroides abscessus]
MGAGEPVGLDRGPGAAHRDRGAGFHRHLRDAVTRAHLRKLISRIQYCNWIRYRWLCVRTTRPCSAGLGPYDRALLDDAAWSHSARTPRLLIE